MEVECRTAFDRASTIRASATTRREVVRPPRGGEVWVDYRVTASEEIAARKWIAPGDPPVRLAFPVHDSVFASVPVWLEEAGEETLTVRLAGSPLRVAPGGEKRAGVVAGPGPEAHPVYDCPERWDEALRAALERGYPAAVWIVRHRGRVDREQIMATEEGMDR